MASITFGGTTVTFGGDTVVFGEDAVPELTNPQNTPTVDGTTAVCVSNDATGTVYLSVRTDRQWYSVANGDSQGLADADKATIIAGTTDANIVFADNQAASLDPEQLIDGLPARLDPANPYYVGWVQGEVDYGKDMVLVFKIEEGALNLTIPNRAGDDFDAYIDWGDGNTSGNITEYLDPELSHDYAEPGDYIVRISGVFSRIYFNLDPMGLKLIRVIQIGDTGLADGYRSFRTCRNLTIVEDALCVFADGFGRCDNMFSDCDLLTYVPAHRFNMSSVPYISSMFSNDIALGDIPIDGWDVTSITLASNFMKLIPGLSTELYNKVLINWQAQSVQPGVEIRFENSIPTGDGLTAKGLLETEDSWVIIDGT